MRSSSRHIKHWRSKEVAGSIQNEKNQTTKQRNKKLDFSSQCLKIHYLICTYEENYAKSSSIVPGTYRDYATWAEWYTLVKFFLGLIKYCWIERRTYYSSDPFSISWAEKRHHFAPDEPLAAKEPVTNVGSYAHGVSKDTAVRAASVPTLILPNKMSIFLKAVWKRCKQWHLLSKKKPKPYVVQ